MGIVKALDLVPQSIHLLGAVCLDLLQRRAIVHPLAVLEDRHQQLPGLEVIHVLSLPGGHGVKDGQALRVVHRLVMHGDVVRDGLAGVAPVQAIHLLEVGNGDLLHVFADLDLGDHGAVRLLDGHQLVHAAEHRLGLGGDHPLAHTEQVDLRALQQHILNEVLVQRVGHGDLALGPAGLIQHLARLAGQVRQVAGIQADTAFGDTQRLEHLVERFDGVGDTGLQRVIGVHQQGRVGGIGLAVGLECLVLVVEHLYPGVGHGAAGGHAVHLVRDGAGRTGTAADIGRPRTDNGRVGPLGTAGAELQHRAALGGPDDTVGLGGDQTLVVDGQQGERLDQLRLDGRCADHHQRLLGEHRRTLRNGVDIAGEAEVPQIVQKLLAEQVSPAEIGDVLLGEVQVLDVVDQLLQTCRDGEAAAIGHLAEKHVEIGDALLAAGLKVAVAHGQLIEVTEHGHVQLFLSFHSYTSNRSLRVAQSVVFFIIQLFSR